MSSDASAIFVPDGDRLRPTRFAEGPWNPAHQHGGPVAGLLARAIDALPSAAPMRITRLTVEMTRPVPMAPLTVETRILRDGRRIQQVEAAVVHDGEVRARTTALRMRTTDGREDAVIADDAVAPVRVAAPAERFDVDHPMVPGFLRAVDYERQTLPERGKPTVAWTRLRVPLVDGETPTPIVRLATLCDFASGTGNPLDFTRWTSINPDLTVHVAREPRGAWIAIEGRTRIEEDGTGLSTARFFDEQGPIAAGMASLLVEPR